MSILITGASSGIGRQLALDYAEKSERVISFNKAAKEAYEQDIETLDKVTLGDFLKEHDIPKVVSDYYLLPMVSAI